MNRAIIGLGSNIQPEVNIPQAKEKIANSFTILKESRFIETEPVGIKNQPNFINGSVLIETSLEMDDLKQLLSTIETELGRDRGGVKGGPRTIDLDILVWNGTVVNMDVRERAFLQQAIHEICPGLELVP
jgi:2-amino-4-hydroxy-6-hydroxymethyldihydropteridine diphosphokinase